MKEIVERLTSIPAGMPAPVRDAALETRDSAESLMQDQIANVSS